MVTQISDWNDLDSAIQGQNGSGDTGDYELVANLDKDTAGYDGIGDSWTPCGTNVTDTAPSGFEGTLDGQGHVIRDLIIDDSGIGPGDGPIGLIGDTIQVGDTTVIKNLGVVGEINLTQSINNVGMIVGLWSSGDTFTNCWSAGAIDSPSCDLVGGVVGETRTDLSDCYSLTEVTADGTVGGFGGKLEATTSRCYAAGSVSGSSDVGGFSGDSTGTEQDCYWDSEATGQSSSGGGATALSTSQMQGSSASSNLSGFDFTNEWKTVEKGGNSGSDGYPYLRGLSVHAQSSVQEARFGPFSVSVTGTNSPVNADGTLTVDIDITNNGSYEGEADIELIVEEA